MTYVFIEINYTLDEEEDNSKSKLDWNLEASRFTIMYSKFIQKKLIVPKDWSSFFLARVLMDRERAGQRGTAKYDLLFNSFKLNNRCNSFVCFPHYYPLTLMSFLLKIIKRRKKVQKKKKKNIRWVEICEGRDREGEYVAS